MVVSPLSQTPGVPLNQGGHSQTNNEINSFTPSGVQGWVGFGVIENSCRDLSSLDIKCYTKHQAGLGDVCQHCFAGPIIDIQITPASLQHTLL